MKNSDIFLISAENMYFDFLREEYTFYVLE